MVSMVHRERLHDFQKVDCECLSVVKFPSVNTASGINSHPEPTTTIMLLSFTYLGTQLGDERSTSHVAYRFMWTGRLEVMLTGLEGCMCGEGTPPVRGSPPRSDILEAGNRAFGRGWKEQNPQ